MLVSDGIIFAMETEGYLRRITQYLDSIGIPHSTFYQRFYKTFISTDYLDSIQFSVLNSIILQAQEKVKEKSAINFEYYRLDGLPWKLYAKMPALINIMINLNRHKFYQAVKSWIIDEFGEDEKLDDLINWSVNSVKWIDYDPEQPTSFVTDYDWTSDKLVKSSYINTPIDKTYTDLHHIIDWQKYDMNERVSRYFIKLCSIGGCNKMFNNIEVSQC